MFARADKINEVNCIAGGGVFKGTDYSTEIGSDCASPDNQIWSGFCGRDPCTLQGYPDAYVKFEEGTVDPSCGEKICTLLPINRKVSRRGSER